MCSHYEPTIDPTQLKLCFEVDTDTDVLLLKAQLWPGLTGPFIRQPPAEFKVTRAPARELLIGSFGLVPHWAKDRLIARRTYNARSETAHEKPSFRDAWRASHHCIIPAAAIFEPDWRTGKSVATRISRADGKPMGIAGLWASWHQPDGAVLHSYTMLTVNADNHDVMRNFHRPGDEKRMIVVLDEPEYDAWLTAPAGASREFLRQYPADNLSCSIAPKPGGNGELV